MQDSPTTGPCRVSPEGGARDSEEGGGASQSYEEMGANQFLRPLRVLRALQRL